MSTKSYQLIDSEGAARQIIQSGGVPALALDRFTGDAVGNTLSLDKARGTFATPTIVSASDVLGEIEFKGHDGSAFVPAARILAKVDGTPGTSDMPASLSFQTSPDGVASPAERMLITASGFVGIGVIPSFKLDVQRTLTSITDNPFPSIRSIAIAAPTADSQSSPVGVYAIATTGEALGFNLSNVVCGMIGSATPDMGAGKTLANAVGVIGEVILNGLTGTGTITNVTSFNANRTVAGGTVTDMAGLNIDAPTLTGGTLTNSYGIYIANQNVGTNKYGIYIEGADTYPLWIDSGLPRIDSTTANGLVATVLGSVGPTGANTTVQEWLTVNINGNTRYIPCF